YLYNEAGKLIQMNATTLIEEEEEMVTAIFKIEFLYDSEGRLEAYNMKIATSEFELPILEAELFYSNSGTRSASEISAYNLVTSAMEKASRSEYEYNESDELVVETQYLWDEELEDWVLDMKDEYQYTNLLFSDVAFPNYGLFMGEFDEDISSQHAIDTVTTYIVEDENWILENQSIYYYTEGPSTNVDQITDNQILIYPNPVTDRIIMSWKGQ